MSLLPKDYRDLWGISTAEFVSQMQRVFPKYTNATDTMANHPKEYGVKLSYEAEKFLNIDPERIKGVGLKDIGLKNRSYLLLMRNGINTPEKLLSCSVYELNSLPRMGEKTFEDVTDAVYRIIQKYGRGGTE